MGSNLIAVVFETLKVFGSQICKILSLQSGITKIVTFVQHGRSHGIPEIFEDKWEQILNIVIKRLSYTFLNSVDAFHRINSIIHVVIFKLDLKVCNEIYEVTHFDFFKLTCGQKALKLRLSL